jgi:TolA-binding protein
MRKKLPTAAFAIPALLTLYVLSFPASVHAGEDADFRRAQHLYTLQEYKLATEALSKYLQDFPKSERAELGRMLLAESFYQLKDFPHAAEHFEKFLADHPASNRRAEALVRAVRVHWATQNFARSLAHGETFIK